MFYKIASFLTRSRISRENISRKKLFLEWNKIEKIALLIDDAESVNKSELDKYIGNIKKYTEVFYLELKSGKPSYGNWKCIFKKDKSIIGLPKDAFLGSINEKQFDLVINVSKQYPLFSANLVSQLKAPFKCGSPDMFGELDLIVERAETQNLISYLNEIARYLKMIRTTE